MKSETQKAEDVHHADSSSSDREAGVDIEYERKLMYAIFSSLFT
jgi:hypothetical protein